MLSQLCEHKFVRFGPVKSWAVCAICKNLGLSNQVRAICAISKHICKISTRSLWPLKSVVGHPNLKGCADDSVSHICFQAPLCGKTACDRTAAFNNPLHS